MGNIKVLDNRLANMIAAGEVVERPSSIIKELVENSVDAQSSNIIVSVYDAGRTRIIVEDDGKGMDEDDALLAFKRHATSKINSELDLFRIKTLGFRGEALPSIASVSKLTLTTSTGNEKGTKLSVFQEDISKTNASSRKGTIVQVEELFYNTPARLKYLKSDYTENANNIEIMCRIALAHPNISFCFYIDDKLQFKTTGRGDLLEVIASIYGFDIANKMVPISIETHDFKVTGYLGKPELSKSSRYYMITLLNGRSVNMPKVQNAITEAYRDFIIPGKFPFAILNLEVDFSLVDVNVHPSKKEVRFSKEDVLRLELIDKIPMALKPKVIYEEVQFKVKEKPNDEKTEQIDLFANKTNEESDSIEQRFHEQFASKKEIFHQIKEDSIDDFKVEIESKNSCPIVALAQINRTYIIGHGTSSDDGFYLIDQHAAMERINYEKFSKLYSSQIQVMSPLVPIVINLNPTEARLLDDGKFEMLKELGIEFESFGHNAYKVTTVPQWINQGDEKSFVEELLHQAMHEDRIDINKLRSYAIATIACKASLKANMTLSEGEMNTLLQRLFMCDNPHNCPHGRPIIIHFTKYELEKMFKRTGL